MALSNKHKKRIDRKFVDIREELAFTQDALESTKEEVIRVRNTIYSIIIVCMFIIFCIVMLFDQIVGKLLFPFINISLGLGYGQIIVAVICVVIMWILSRKIK